LLRFEEKIFLLTNSQLAMAVLAPRVNTTMLAFNNCSTMKRTNSNLLDLVSSFKVAPDKDSYWFEYILPLF